MEIFRGYDGEDLLVRPTANMRIREEFIPLLVNGLKLAEVRIAYPNIRQIGVGTIIRYNGLPDLLRQVIRATSYESFDDVYKSEDPKMIYPYASAQQQLSFLRRMHNSQDEQQYGVRVFELRKI